MSTAQKLIDQGRKESYEFLIALLGNKFGEIPDWVHVKLKKASSEMLKTWFSTSLEKDRIEDVFA